MTDSAPNASRDEALSEDGNHDLPEFGDWVRVLLLQGDFERMLIVHETTHWDLPSFQYSRTNSIRDGSCIDNLNIAVREWFQIDSSVHFTAVVDLFGDMVMTKQRDSPEGTEELNVSLYVMEPHGISAGDLLLPPGAEWKETSLVSSLAESNGPPYMHRVAKPLIRYISSRGVMKDPRYQLGWHAKAGKFLLSAAFEDGAVAHGDVKQVQVTCDSTIIKLNSSKGWYYAKAPAIGNNEFAITAKIADIFPKSLPVVVGTSTQLRCFISREFRDVKPHLTDFPVIVEKLADLQIRSLSHIEELEEAGCPVRGPDVLKTQLNVWAECNFVKNDWIIKGRFELMAPVVMDLCEKLQGFKIPCSLLHGDFARSNAAFANADKEGVILFDWQFACIGHPFCDFHRLYDDLPEDMRDEVVGAYLRRWSEFGDMTSLMEAFKIAKCLGWLLKLWTVSESLESCEHQRRSELESWAESLVNFTVGSLCLAKFLE